MQIIKNKNKKYANTKTEQTDKLKRNHIMINTELLFIFQQQNKLVLIKNKQIKIPFEYELKEKT